MERVEEQRRNNNRTQQECLEPVKTIGREYRRFFGTVMGNMDVTHKPFSVHQDVAQVKMDLIPEEQNRYFYKAYPVERIGNM